MIKSTVAPRLIRRVFLAGKITGNAWRSALVKGDLSLPLPYDQPCAFSHIALMSRSEAEKVFPVREKAILSMLDYVGPYYIYPPGGTCRCASSSHNHGTWDQLGKSILLGANEEAIKRCDVVFAWLDDAAALATCYEIGYARALGKEIWLAGPKVIEDMGMVYHAGEPSVYSSWGGPDLNEGPLDAFARCLASRCCPSHPLRDDAPLSVDPDALSPIEGRFLEAWNEQARDHSRWLGLVPQYPLEGGRYRVDFAHLGFFGDPRIAIEIDGLEAHRTTDQIANDRKRQRAIEALGWRVIRFGGKEVHQDAARCVSEVRRIIK